MTSLEEKVRNLGNKNSDLQKDLQEKLSESQPITTKSSSTSSTLRSNYTPTYTATSTKSTNTLNPCLSSIETSNIFTVLDEDSNHNTKPIEAKVKPMIEKLPKIDETNFKKAFLDFLKNFGEPTSELPKYHMVAMQMIKNNYNMFHVSYDDIKKFNINLAGFISAQKLKFNLDIIASIKEFIQDQNLGDLKSELYFSLNRIK